jgi:cell division transport system ATP-binding protein
MGYVFQDFRLFENKTVFENVAFAMEVLGEPKSEINKKVPIAIGIVGLTGKEKVMPAKLSGGEKQRLCVARAIVNNPSVIVADEPTGNLDTKLAEGIMDLLVKISRFGKTVIVVTHASELVKQYDERVIFIENGRLVKDSKYPEISGLTAADSELDVNEDINNASIVSKEDGTDAPEMSFIDFTDSMYTPDDDKEAE